MGPVSVPPIIPITKSNCGKSSAMVTVNAMIIERKMHRLMLKSVEKTKRDETDQLNRSTIMHLKYKHFGMRRYSSIFWNKAELLTA